MRELLPSIVVGSKKNEEKEKKKEKEGGNLTRKCERRERSKNTKRQIFQQQEENYHSFKLANVVNVCPLFFKCIVRLGQKVNEFFTRNRNFVARLISSCILVMVIYPRY